MNQKMKRGTPPPTSELLTSFKRGGVVRWRSPDCNETVPGHGHIKICVVGRTRPWLISVPATIKPRGRSDIPTGDVTQRY